MQCPKCGSDNADNRVACWNCFASLRTAADDKPVSTKKAEPAAPGHIAEAPVPAEADVASPYVVPGLAESPETVSEKPENAVP
jgi:hypothetical protein